MADAETLKNELMRLQAEVESRREQANRSAMRASGDRAENDDASAAANENEANKLKQEADQKEARAKQLEAQLTDSLVQIENLKRKREELEKRRNREIEEINQQINRLSGGTGAISTPIPSLF